MEYIEVKIPITCANDLASCIEVGVEGADHLDAGMVADIEGVVGDIRGLAEQKINSINGTFHKLFGKG